MPDTSDMPPPSEPPPSAPPPSAPPAESAIGVAAAATEAVALSEIRAALAALQSRRRSAFGNLAALLLSVGLFIALGLFSASWEIVVMVVLVLFVHELGHLAGMKAFGYRDVHMFFIPLLGAAVAGSDTNPSGIRKAVVSLLGPMPGIVVGAVLGVAYMVCGHAWLLQLSRTFTLLNAFNLLPFHPLDGGRFLAVSLFSRQPRIEVAFKFVTGLGLAGIAVALREPFLGIFAFFILISLRLGYATASIAQRLRATLPSGTVWVPGQIPDACLAVIADEIRAHLPAPQRTPRIIAAQARNVWARVCNRPPSPMAAVGLLCVYVACVSLAILIPLIIEIGAAAIRGRG